MIPFRETAPTAEYRERGPVVATVGGVAPKPDGKPDYVNSMREIQDHGLR